MKKCHLSRLNPMPSKQHNHNPQYCGVCGVWVVGLTQHNTRSKTHERLYAPIRKRLAEQRAAQRAAK